MATESDQSPVIGRKLSELVNHVEDDPNELLKYRFLGREGLLGIYGPTGIGKSSLAMQMMILWSLGREAFGIFPKRPLKSVLIQAENDDGDIAEMRDGVIAGLMLSSDEAKQACDNIIIIHEDSQTGKEFFDLIVRIALEQHKPDLLWIDPALHFLGGDSISQEIVGCFLRTLLKPLLKIHQCGCVIIHHTNKSGNSDSAYAGSGSAEWANMPRAILTLTPAGKTGFALFAAKRGGRLRWKESDGATGTLSKLLKHSKVEGQIFWSEMPSGERTISEKINKAQIDEDGLLACVPDIGPIEKSTLEFIINEKTRIGQNRVRILVKKLIADKKLIVSLVPRPNARPEIHLCRPPASKLVTGS